MKRLAILTLLATPAFAHYVPFDEPKYLKLGAEDPEKALAIKRFCDSNGYDFAGCEKKFSGHGNIAAEAALKCEQERVAKLPDYSYGNNKETPGSRAHKLGGLTVHETEVDGHSHGYTQDARLISANRSYTERLDQIVKENTALKGTESKSSGTAATGKFEVGIPMVLSVGLDFGGNNSKIIAPGMLTTDQIMQLNSSWLAGWNTPHAFGIEPDVYLDANGKPLTGNQPAPKMTREQLKEKQEAEKKKDEEKKTPDEKKGAENPPKSEETQAHDVPDIHSTSGGEMLAGESNLDVSGIATPVMDDLAALSPMESCVRRETKRLTDNLGRMNVDPNSLEANESEDEKAKKLLKFGYCDEQVLGKAACLAKKIQEDSVVAVTIQEERKEAAKHALESYKVTGICNPNALGREFCRAEKYKWETTPTGRLEIPSDGSRITKPIKSGDIPKLNN